MYIVFGGLPNRYRGVAECNFPRSRCSNMWIPETRNDRSTNIVVEPKNGVPKASLLLALSIKIIHLEVLKIFFKRIKVNQDIFPILSAQILEPLDLTRTLLLEMNEEIIVRIRRREYLLLSAPIQDEHVP
jgi:hypothetical protein